MTDIAPLAEPTEAEVFVLVSERARKRLREAADLLEHIRMSRIPGVVNAADGMPRASKSAPPIPLRADAIDVSDDAYARLLEWVDYWADELQPGTYPVTAVYARQSGVHGFRATSTPAGVRVLTANVTTWLLALHDRIEPHPGARAYFEDVADIFERAHSIFPLTPKIPLAHYRRPCPVCGRYAVTANWPYQAAPQDVSVYCTDCGYLVPSKQYRKILEAFG